VQGGHCHACSALVRAAGTSRQQATADFTAAHPPCTPNRPPAAIPAAAGLVAHIERLVAGALLQRGKNEGGRESVSKHSSLKVSCYGPRAREQGAPSASMPVPLQRTPPPHAARAGRHPLPLPVPHHPSAVLQSPPARAGLLCGSCIGLARSVRGKPRPL